MQITLVRHGRPDFSGGRVAARELIQAHRRYDAAGIRSDFPPPSRLRAEASRADIILASDRPRAVESAECLDRAGALLVDPLFREVPPPHSLPAPGAFRLPYGAWTVMCRILWLARCVRGPETVPDAKERARRGCDILIEHGEGRRAVLLVAHNMINVLIGHELLRRAWRGPAFPTGRYWASYTYRPSLETARLTAPVTSAPSSGT